MLIYNFEKTSIITSLQKIIQFHFFVKYIKSILTALPADTFALVRCPLAREIWPLEAGWVS